MAYFLFIDESGRDHGEAPYEVLAGVAVQDRDLWNLVKALQDLEMQHFGMRYTHGRRELKGKKILKRKVFRLAYETEPISEDDRVLLAKRCLENGAASGFRELCALAQAKHAYVLDVLDTCGRFRCKVFASILANETPYLAAENRLRKDYAYLFERFFYFLEDTDANASGIIVFDELDKTESHLLAQQMDKYFKLTTKGRQRAGQIIPEPFFVHSELTTGVQLADLVAYLVSWGFRTGDLKKPARSELAEMVTKLCLLRHKTTRPVGDNQNFEIWSFAVITDLRGKNKFKNI